MVGDCSAFHSRRRSRGVERSQPCRPPPLGPPSSPHRVCDPDSCHHRRSASQRPRLRLAAASVRAHPSRPDVPRRHLARTRRRLDPRRRDHFCRRRRRARPGNALRPRPARPVTSLEHRDLRPGDQRSPSRRDNARRPPRLLGPPLRRDHGQPLGRCAAAGPRPRPPRLGAQPESSPAPPLPNFSSRSSPTAAIPSGEAPSTPSPTPTTAPT